MLLKIAIMVNAFARLNANPNSFFISHLIDKDTLKANNI